MTSVRRFLTAATVWLAVSANQADAAGAEARGEKPGETQNLTSPRTVLRVATSEDGLEFTDTGQVAVPDAAEADMVRLPNGDLLAVFDYQSPAVPKTGPAPAVSRSQDEGKTWSSPRPVRFRGLASDRLQVRHLDLIVIPSGFVRLYFQMQDRADRQAAGEPDSPRNRRGGSIIGSAVTRNGVDYEVDRAVRIPIEGGIKVRPSSVWIGQRLDLFVAAAERNSYPGRGITIQRYRSSDGRQFEPLGRDRQAGPIGSILPIDRGQFRMFLSDRDGITSMASRDGERWVAETGVRLKSGCDPAVVGLSGNRFLMLYTAAAAHPDSQPAAIVTDGSGQPAPALQDGAGATNQTDEPAWAPFTNAGLESELGGQWSDARTDPDGIELAPRPDFVEPIDYARWFQDHFVLAPEDNAYSAYESLFTEPQDGPEWALNDRLSSGGMFGPPAPWSPAEHPDWEVSYQASQGVMARFREATADPRYFQSPLIFRPDEFSEAPDVGRPLFTGVLTGLAVTRGLCKATLAQAWRAEDGRASPEAMREAFQTVLRNANHIQEGATLVEGLVSIALRNLAHDEARWALRQNVFASADEIEAALQTLRDNDALDPDAAQWLQAEHCLIMDYLQYMFTPTEPGGEPGINVERAKFVDELVDQRVLTDEQIARLAPEDAQAAADTVESFFSEVREYWLVGYPSVREADMHALLDKHGVLADPLARAMMWSPGRVYHLQTRVEASRRATQLAYEAELFRARHGRYPASLDEMPDDGGYDIKVDPFTGSYFNYRLDDNGPTIYTASENGIDDGGIHSRHWADRADENGGSDDYVFYPPR